MLLLLCIIADNGITATAFATDFTKEDIKDPELGFSFAGKKVLRRVWTESRPKS